MFDLKDRRVVIARCRNYRRESIETALDQIFTVFPIADAVRGKTVLIKANLLTAHAPEKAATTHPAVVEALARRLFAEGALSVTIGDSPGGIFTRSALDVVYKATGMDLAAQRSGAELNYLTEEAEISSPDGRRTMRLAAYVRSADVVISVAKLKTHTYARMTAAVKNLYGAVAGLEKAKFHAKIPDRSEFAKLLVKICNTVAPDFSLIDGVLGMEGKGPGTGDPKWAHCLLAAQNPYCLDLAAAAVIGMPANRVPTIVEGIRRGYSPANADDLNVIGVPLKEAYVRFVPPPYMKSVGLLSLLPGSLKDPVAKYLEAYPVVTDKCIGCGECARACPKQTIRIRDHKAVIDYSQCIKCYCCHEMCRLKAIELKKRLFAPK